jgi:hypothetical protein
MLAKIKRNIDVLPTCFKRTQAEQDVLFKDGKSRVQHSAHQDWLAIDIVIVREGVLIWKIDSDYEWLGSVWEGMGHIWGGRWKTFKDGCHFQEGGVV